ncbi:MAG TPA: 4-(cytidine 5'-diphospho)-2-C-methyl-D-erythritol kinase [Kaistiaceae bacterium]|nr:4-(cytidine 5'-diphospho)-2-C-methyl-D-erythritol kinase [Kaistiaceae bacterium]
MVRVPAPAKLNLALHVVGRRADGYHLLDMLVAFADVGDVVGAEAASGLALARSGPFAEGLGPVADDLVMMAAARLAEAAGRDIAAAGAALHLEKNLPVASGIGGGSADAAATLKALVALWQVSLPQGELEAIALSLGADVPMCLAGVPARVTGVGETVQPYGGLPELDLVLVNPGVAVSTPAVFRALASRDNPPLPALPQRFPAPGDLVDWLATARNDLEAAAIGLTPAIGEALSAIRSMPGALFARMSGSGATSFGIFETAAAAEAAAAAIAAAHPGWWVRQSRSRPPAPGT